MYPDDKHLSRYCPSCKRRFGDLQNIIKSWYSGFGDKYTLHTCPHCGKYVVHGSGIDETPEPDEWFMEGLDKSNESDNLRKEAPP